MAVRLLRARRVPVHLAVPGVRRAHPDRKDYRPAGRNDYAALAGGFLAAGFGLPGIGFGRAAAAFSAAA